MKLASVLVAMCCLLSAASGEPDSLVQSIVNSVSQDSVGATILRLQQFGTRECTTDSNYAAVLYARDRMVGYACDTVYLYSTDTSGYYKPSVIGVKRGRLYPEIEYIVCGHIDAVGDTYGSAAPGADDNASGVSVVLEACRVFAEHWFNYTLRFACSNCEEYGPSGAGHYAYEARLRGDSILGVLNFDMVGYGIEGQDSVFVAGADSNPNCSDLLQCWVFAANAYTDLKYRPFLCDRGFVGSDLSMFLCNGYKGLWTMEVQKTPEAHGPGDTLGPYGYESCGVNNLPLCTEAAKACVATLALLAQVDGTPGVTEAERWPPRSSEPISTLARKLPAGAVAFDAMGRRVLRPKPGIYFVRQASGVKHEASSVTKVVVTR